MLLRVSVFADAQGMGGGSSVHGGGIGGAMGNHLGHMVKHTIVGLKSVARLSCCVVVQNIIFVVASQALYCR